MRCVVAAFAGIALWEAAMFAMIVAAAVVASGPVAMDPAASAHAWAVRGPSPFAASSACKATGRYQTDWEPALLYRPEDRIRPKRLEALPRPDYEKAVMRTVDGCAAPLVMGTSVGR
jgi:hypothetical protein